MNLPNITYNLSAGDECIYMSPSYDKENGMKKTLLLFLTILIGFSFTGVSGEANLKYYVENTQTITKDNLYEVNDAVENNDYIFSFTAPDSSFYVFETYGEVDTSIELNSNSQDDDNGYSTNEVIGFDATYNTTYVFTVTAEDITGDDIIYVQVRTQTVSVYAVDDNLAQNPIDTTPNIDTVEDLFDSNGTYPDMYEVNSVTNFGSSFTSDTNDKGLVGLNSEIVVYSSHGEDGKFSYFTGSGYTYVNSDQLPDMSNVKLVIWASCHSADDSLTQNSVAQQSIYNGADVAIGWEGSVSSYSTQLFIGYLLEGIVVNTSATNPLSISDLVDQAYDDTIDQLIEEEEWGLDNFHDYVVFGNTNAVLYTTATAINDKSSTDDYIPEFEVSPPGSPTISTLDVAERYVEFRYTNNTDQVVNVYAEKNDSTPDVYIGTLDPGEYIDYTFTYLIPDRLYTFYVRFGDVHRQGVYSSSSSRTIRTLGGDIIIW